MSLDHKETTDSSESPQKKPAIRRPGRFAAGILAVSAILGGASKHAEHVVAGGGDTTQITAQALEDVLDEKARIAEADKARVQEVLLANEDYTAQVLWDINGEETFGLSPQGLLDLKAAVVAKLRAEKDYGALVSGFEYYRGCVGDIAAFNEGVDAMIASPAILIQSADDLAMLGDEKAKAILMQLEEKLSQSRPDMLLSEGKRAIINLFGQEHYDALALRIVNKHVREKDYSGLHSLHKQWRHLTPRISPADLVAYGNWLVINLPIDLDQNSSFLDGIDATKRAEMLEKAHTRAAEKSSAYMKEWERKGVWHEFLYKYNAWAPYVQNTQLVMDKALDGMRKRSDGLSGYGNVLNRNSTQEVLRTVYGEEQAKQILAEGGFDWRLDKSQ